MVIKAEGNLASNIIGKTVYNGTSDDAQNIGSVNDLVIAPDGKVQAVVIGVGGFLGVGQKDVAIEYDLVQWAERNNDRYLVVDTTADALKALNDFDRNAYKPMPADADVTETKPANKEELDTAKTQAEQEKAAQDTQAQAPATMPAPGAPAAPVPPADTTAQAPVNDNAPADQTRTGAIDRSTLTAVPLMEMRSEDLVGTTVYGANDERIGEVGDIVMSQDKVDAVILDVGGFLGIGEKEVAVGMDNLAFMKDADGDYYLYTAFTKEQLEAQPAYDESTYAESRDKMRMAVPPQ
jgi:sporulation protein YlmC with PRC-barrel domain